MHKNLQAYFELLLILSIIVAVQKKLYVWKQRFRCLQIPLKTKLDNTLPIMVATACLNDLGKAEE